MSFPFYFPLYWRNCNFILLKFSNRCKYRSSIDFDLQKIFISVHLKNFVIQDFFKTAEKKYFQICKTLIREKIKNCFLFLWVGERKRFYFVSNIKSNGAWGFHHQAILYVLCIYKIYACVSLYSVNIFNSYTELFFRRYCQILIEKISKIVYNKTRGQWIVQNHYPQNNTKRLRLNVSPVFLLSNFMD